MTESFDLKTLSVRAGVTPRTIHYYIQQGLLPPSDGAGRGASYGSGHLARLRLIRRLQRDHLPLSEIRRQLDILSDGEIEGLLAERDSARPPSTALDYVRRVLAGENEPVITPAQATVWSEPDALPSPPLARSGAGINSVPAATAPGRSQWERIALTEDIELHIRRPLGREQNRQVDRLLGVAREIFRGDDR